MFRDGMHITTFDRWVGENNIPDTYEYSRGWWDYVEIVRRLSSKFNIADVRVDRSPHPR